MSVSTLIIFIGAATPSSVVNFSIAAFSGRFVFAGLCRLGQDAEVPSVMRYSAACLRALRSNLRLVLDVADLEL